MFTPLFGFSRAQIVFGAACLFAAVACDKTPPPSTRATGDAAEKALHVEGQTVRASGSSALQPLVNAAKEKYEVQNKGASIEVSAGGSKKGLSDVASGAVHIGNSDIFAPADLAGELVDHKVAVVGFAAMANKGPYNETIAALSQDDLANVFSGKVTNWKELGGELQPIVVINRAAGSGTRTVFGRIVLGGDKFVESQTEDNSGALVAKLKQTKGAISYLALSFKDDALLTISLKGEGGTVDPTAENITSGRYPIWSYEHMYTKGEPDKATKAFLDYVTSPRFQNEVLPNVKGFIPVTAMKVSRSTD
ncbi:MAG: phosphate ABC transporter substrate-binding protein [Polyangiaceae bacterium]|nr:phosphate ABC transporter substrate-binding protein [Polyangiaceae bacterium]